MEVKAFIARDKDGDLYIYTKGKPYKCAFVWSTGNPICAAKIDNNIFPEIKWEDKEPTEVTIEIVGEKAQQPQEQLKPQTKFDPKMLKPFERVLVRDTHDEEWRCELFSHICTKRAFACGSTFYWFCRPYNEETKHLVGTNQDAPEYYRYWED